jgi:hypothetical protein
MSTTTTVAYESFTIQRAHDIRSARDRYTVDRFPAVAAFSLQLLADAPPRLLRLGVDASQVLIHLRFDNGRATYQVVDCDNERGWLIAELRTCEEPA